MPRSHNSQYFAADPRDRLMFFPRSNLRFPFDHSSRRLARVWGFPQLLQRRLSGHLGCQRGKPSDQPVEHPIRQREQIQSY